MSDDTNPNFANLKGHPLSWSENINRDRIDRATREHKEGRPTAREKLDLSALLAELGELEYQQRRAELAKTAGIGVGALDAVRKDARRAARAKAKSRDDGEPWPEPVDGKELAADVEAALRRFVVLAQHAYVLVVLWIIGTFTYMKRNVYPLLLARSPQPACGKSTLLDVAERLVAQPFAAGNASLATLFRSAATGPTQLLDELDRWLERDPEIVGFLCAGWQSGRPFLRCDPETFELREFPCYTPKGVALIGDVKDEALRSRCIVIEMRRALPGERPERFRAARAYPGLAELRAKAGRWAADNADAVGAYELAEDELAGLSGRAADNAEALLAVAEAIGGEWPARCREALVAAPVDEPQDLAAMLLADLRDLLDTMEPDAEAIATQRILDHLLALDDRPWPTISRGKPMTADWLRRRLRPFGARPARHWVGGMRQRGYLIDPLREAITRYVPPLSDPPETGVQVSQVSRRAASDALSAPDSPSSGHLATLATCTEGSEGIGTRGRIAPLAVGSEPWHEWQERAAVLEDAGMERAEAEYQAAEELGLVLPLAEAEGQLSLSLVPVPGDAAPESRP